MKKILLFTAILFASITMGNAQTSSDVAILKVRLHAIQSIVVNPSQKFNDLDYTTTDNYKNGVSLLRENHLTIFSTGAFVVKVASATNDIKRENGNKTISASTLKVKAEVGTNNKLTGATMAEVSLSDTPTNLINSGTGGVNRYFNVTYSGLGGDGYVNYYFNNENPTVYRTTVTYTIAPQ